MRYNTIKLFELNSNYEIEMKTKSVTQFSFLSVNNNKMDCVEMHDLRSM